MTHTVQQIIEQQQEIIERISEIRIMERGTISRQTYPERAKRKEGKGAVGPYCLWQGTVGGKRFGKRISGPEAEQVEDAIAQRHEFEALCDKYVDLGCQLRALADESSASAEALKKGLKSKSKRARK